MKVRYFYFWQKSALCYCLKISIYIFLSIISVKSAYAQLSPYITELNRQSMNPASLSKGMPSISIPLFDIEFGGEKIPFVLNYYASGVRANQTSGEVGIGWSLSPNFRVTEHNIYPVPNIDSIATLLDTKTGFDRDSTLAKFITTNGLLPDELLKSKKYDGEYGISTYVLADRTGSFIKYSQDSVILLSTPQNNLSFKLIGAYSMLEDPAYVITDDRGWKYVFGENEQGEFNGNDACFLTNRVYAPNGDILHFQYENGSYSEVIPPSFHAAINIIEGRNNGYAYSPLTTVGIDTTTTTGEIFYSRRVLQINHNKGSVYYSREGGLLYSLSSYDLSGLVEKDVQFYYSEDNGKTFLDSITITGSSKAYGFKYYHKEDTTYTNAILNDKYIINHGEYIEVFPAEAKFSRVGIPDEISTVPIYNLHEQGHPSQNTDSTLGDVMEPTLMLPRSVASGNAYMLKRINQRGGGFTEYIYEPHLISGSNYAPGLRISEIFSNDGLTGITMHKKYTYGENGNGLGYYPRAYTEIGYSYIQQKAIVGGELDVSGTTITNWSLFNSYLISNKPGYLSQQPVYYTKVVEEYVNAEEEMGKTEYIYSQESTDGIQLLQTNPMPNIGGRGQLSRTYPPVVKGNQYPGKEPLLLYKNYYKKQESIWKKVREEKNIYQHYQNTQVPYLKNLVVRQYASMGGWPTLIYPTSHLNEESIYSVGNIQSFFDYGFYNIYTDWFKLIHTKVTEYHD